MAEKTMITTVDGLNALRDRYAELTSIAGRLDALGEPFMAQDLRDKAARLTAMQILVAVECLLGPERHTFLMECRVDEPGHQIEAAVCGPCNARTTAEVLKVEEIMKEGTE